MGKCSVCTGIHVPAEFAFIVTDNIDNFAADLIEPRLVKFRVKDVGVVNRFEVIKEFFILGKHKLEKLLVLLHISTVRKISTFCNTVYNKPHYDGR